MAQFIEGPHTRNISGEVLQLYFWLASNPYSRVVRHHLKLAPSLLPDRTCRNLWAKIPRINECNVVRKRQSTSFDMVKCSVGMLPALMNIQPVRPHAQKWFWSDQSGSIEIGIPGMVCITHELLHFFYSLYKYTTDFQDITWICLVFSLIPSHIRDIFFSIT